VHADQKHPLLSSPLLSSLVLLESYRLLATNPLRNPVAFTNVDASVLCFPIPSLLACRASRLSRTLVTVSCWLPQNEVYVNYGSSSSSSYHDPLQFTSVNKSDCQMSVVSFRQKQVRWKFHITLSCTSRVPRAPLHTPLEQLH
jgi:hypothetical protein